MDLEHFENEGEGKPSHSKDFVPSWPTVSVVPP